MYASYYSIGPTLHYRAQFGIGTGPVGWSYVYCKGWETTIHDCTRSTYPSFTCYPQYTVGVTCKEGKCNNDTACIVICTCIDCANGDVRVLGGGFDNEGTVEVCYNNIWGVISDQGWTSADARVVCNQLGYTTGSM